MPLSLNVSVRARAKYIVEIVSSPRVPVVIMARNPSTNRATIHDVAEAAGVSVGTVSRVINGNATVNGAIRSQVERAMTTLNYAPNGLARSMRLGTTQSIGVVMRDITVPIFADLVGAIEDTLEADGYSLLLACSQDKKERELASLRMFTQKKVDGLIMTTCDERDPEIVLARKALAVPIVFMDRDVPGHRDAVDIAHRAGTRDAVKYLLELGHTRIGLITGSDALYPGRERLAGYTDAFDAAGLTPDMSLVRADNFLRDTSFSHAMDLLDGRDRATAVIAGGFNMLAQVLRAARQRGLSVPDDVSVIAGADSELAQLASPTITAIGWDMTSVGQAAARILLERLGKRSKGQRRLHFPTELMIRGSCAPPRRLARARSARERTIAAGDRPAP
jgi:LacI family transcriptional regulator